jgi:DHA1 family tetracycline resistance protein-like MFS transporter
VSHRPAGDWLIGLPFFVSSALQLTAAIIAWRFFRSHKKLRAQAA